MNFSFVVTCSWYVFHVYFQVIPRATKFPQRRYGGSLRCTTNPHRQSLEADGRDGCTTGMSSTGGHNVGRSNSFRFNRPRNAFTSASSSGLNSLGIGPGAVGITSTSKLSGGSSGNLLCKHIKYCCLHQQQHQQQKSMPPHASSCMNHPQQQQQLFQQQQQQHQHQHQPSIHYGQQQKSYQQHDYSNNSSNSVPGSSGMQHATSSTRLGPDGEDNTSGPLNNGVSNCLGNGQHHHQQQQQQQSSKQQQQHQQPQKRHSIILERAFDFGK